MTRGLQALLLTIAGGMLASSSLVCAGPSQSSRGPDPTSSGSQGLVTGAWTWVGGLADYFSYGIYGTKGTPSASNLPGARSGAASAIDAKGNLWIFGGQGYAASGGKGDLNDLWRWDGTGWTWLSGSDVTGHPGSYGTKGIRSSSNLPPARYGATAWIDPAGNFWLFGGQTYASSYYYRNDLWSWDGTSWTWFSGVSVPSGQASYGAQGVPSPTNMPPGRTGMASWVGRDGGLWLHGGYSTEGERNDLWKWDGTNWTWVHGSNTGNAAGAYGTKGTPSPTNEPRARYGAASWTDAKGDFWLFGGNGPGGQLNDLWRWDGTSWTWISGSDGIDKFGTYGPRGIPSPSAVPGARVYPFSWTDGLGNLFLFGGYGFGAAWRGELSDLWRWDGTSWTWVSGPDWADEAGSYGTIGAPSPTSAPGGRHGGVSWKGGNGDLFVFGGEGHDASWTGTLDDLWKWDGTSWTWTGGRDSVHYLGGGSYGPKGNPSPTSVPPARTSGASWTDANGSFWLFGGWGYFPNYWTIRGGLNDLWRWDGTSWTWFSGAAAPGQLGTYGSKGVPSPGNAPGARGGSASWTDQRGRLWLFSGYGVDDYYGNRDGNDLWAWNGTGWAWTWGAGSGALSVVRPSYGTKGLPSFTNAPPSRTGSVTWTDPKDNLWLFGGYGFTGSGQSGVLNDLWRWDGSIWTWMGGSNQTDQTGSYGKLGLPSASNVPGGRTGATAWTDDNGVFWLFGGSGFAASGPRGPLNDLWKWDGASWTWVAGSDASSPGSSRGTKGVPASSNVPAARSEAMSWKDSSGNLWLFGGNSPTGLDWAYLSDLWRWDGANWTWVSGPPEAWQTGSYGTRGLPSPSNGPGARAGGSTSTDAAGRLWLFGGEGYGRSAVAVPLNDLWAFTVSNDSPCTIDCSATVPERGATGLSLPFASASPGSDCGGPATYLWDFGDGEGSAVQNPAHVYSLPGTYSWSLTVASGFQSCKKAGKLEVACAGSTCSCPADPRVLCLRNGRFQVRAEYLDYAGGHGVGSGVALTSDTGYFWFFSPTNVELVVKMVPFCTGDSGDVAVYAGGLTDLGVTIHVTDTFTGKTVDYSNPLGTGFRLVRDAPFRCPSSPPASGIGKASGAPSPIPLLASTAGCSADGYSLCLLGDRFELRASYADYAGSTGNGHAVSITPDTGYFWFFGASNVEIVVKMVPFCDGGSHNVALYAGGLTDVEVTLTVRDTRSGLVETYSNALAHPFDLIRDGPFACSP